MWLIKKIFWVFQCQDQNPKNRYSFPVDKQSILWQLFYSLDAMQHSFKYMTWQMKILINNLIFVAWMFLQRIPRRQGNLHSCPLEDSCSEVCICDCIWARGVRGVQADRHPRAWHTWVPGYQGEERALPCKGGSPRCRTCSSKSTEGCRFWLYWLWHGDKHVSSAEKETKPR